jgi:hypothetical protein
MTPEDVTILCDFLTQIARGNDAVLPILADWLEDRGDPRSAQVREAKLHVQEVAGWLAVVRNPPRFDPALRDQFREAARLALAGAEVPADVAEALALARRQKIAWLFPEVR